MEVEVDSTVRRGQRHSEPQRPPNSFSQADDAGAYPLFLACARFVSFPNERGPVQGARARNVPSNVKADQQGGKGREPHAKRFTA